MQFDAFAYPAFEQITSHLAKMRNRTKGRVTLPIVIRIPYAGGIGGVEHHSDSSEAYYTHTPGLTVVTPSNPADAYSMLREAIRSDDPVIFLEPKSRYWAKGTVALPVQTAPMTRAAVLREGTDVTLLAYGPTVKTALRAAELGAAEGLSIEVVDLRSLSPFDDETVGVSVRKTSRAAIIHEAAQFGGYGAEVAARVTERNFFHLAAPVLRITGVRRAVSVAQARGALPADRRACARGTRHLGVVSVVTDVLSAADTAAAPAAAAPAAAAPAAAAPAPAATAAPRCCYRRRRGSSDGCA